MTLTNFPNGIKIGNKVQFDSDGITLSDTVWDDLRVPVLSTKLGGTDDYANDAALLEIDFHYESDRIGSDNEYS